MTVRTRFAPSPTGYLHIGGVRTALFNYLFAKQAGGQFILRIDDTDSRRNVVEALQPILDGFRWLGIDWDEGPEVDGPCAPYFQSQRLERYQDAVAKLLASGHAYRDYATPEEMQSWREVAEKNGETFIYDRRFMAESDEQAAQFEAEGRPKVVRLKMPREGSCQFTDRIRGSLEFDWNGEADHVIQRGDGTCLYHLASVVDDADFQITHVIRAVEHLSNTPRQIFIAQSLGLPVPQFAHLPYVAEPGGTAKLSKRKLEKYLKQKDFKELNQLGLHVANELQLQTNQEAFNPVVVDFYRETGFAPEAILNYLLLLGWSLDGEREKFTLKEATELFSLDRVNKSPASFDPQKLQSFQAKWMSEQDVEQRVQQILPFATAKGWVHSPPVAGEIQLLEQIVRAADNRIKIGSDILQFDDFFTDDENLAYDEPAFEKRVNQDSEAVELVDAFAARLKKIEPFHVENVESELKGLLNERGLKFGAIIHALRLLVTGKAQGFGMMDSIVILGKERCLNRIEIGKRRSKVSEHE